MMAGILLSMYVVWLLFLGGKGARCGLSVDEIGYKGWREGVHGRTDLWEEEQRGKIFYILRNDADPIQTQFYSITDFFLGSER